MIDEDAQLRFGIGHKDAGDLIILAHLRDKAGLKQNELAQKVTWSPAVLSVDTKGIDRTAERRDLEEYFNAPNTIVVLCSSFNDAPSNSVQQLLERAEKGRVANLQDKAAVLALPRPDEALTVKFADGSHAINAQALVELVEKEWREILNRLIDLRVRTG